jgi:hypothetical protein
LQTKKRNLVTFLYLCFTLKLNNESTFYEQRERKKERSRNIKEPNSESRNREKRKDQHQQMFHLTFGRISSNLLTLKAPIGLNLENVKQIFCEIFFCRPPQNLEILSKYLLKFHCCVSLCDLNLNCKLISLLFAQNIISFFNFYKNNKNYERYFFVVEIKVCQLIKSSCKRKKWQSILFSTSHYERKEFVIKSTKKVFVPKSFSLQCKVQLLLKLHNLLDHLR